MLTFGGLLYRPPITDEGQIWYAKADRSSTFTGRISSECVHCVAFLINAKRKVTLNFGLRPKSKTKTYRLNQSLRPKFGLKPKLI